MPGQWLFPGRRGPDEHLTTRQYARLVGEWVSGIGLDPLKFATHSMRRTKATLIYRRTGNLRAVQLLLGHTKIESTVRYFGVEVDDALEIAEKIDICRAAVLCPMQYRRVRATSRLIQRGRSDKTLRSISALSAMTRRAFLLTVGFEHTAAR